MVQETQSDIQLMIRKELENHKPVVSANLIKWFIGTFFTFSVLIAFNIGVNWDRINDVERRQDNTEKIINKIDFTELKWTKYRSDYLWAERFKQEPPASPNNTRGGSGGSNK